MSEKKVKIVDSINSRLAIEAIELGEIADELSEQFINLNSENAASIRENLDSIEIKLTDAYLCISSLNEEINNLINKRK